MCVCEYERECVSVCVCVCVCERERERNLMRIQSEKSCERIHLDKKIYQVENFGIKTTIYSIFKRKRK